MCRVRAKVQDQVWLKDSSDSVYVYCRIVADWNVLSCKAEPLENNGQVETEETENGNGKGEKW